MLEQLDIVSLPSILTRIADELEDKLPNKGRFEPFYYVYKSPSCYTPRIIFEFTCIDSKDLTCPELAVFLSGIFPDMPLRKMAWHLIAGSKSEIKKYFRSPEAPQIVMEAIDKLDDAIRFHD